MNSSLRPQVPPLERSWLPQARALFGRSQVPRVVLMGQFVVAACGAESEGATAVDSRLAGDSGFEAGAAENSGTATSADDSTDTTSASSLDDEAVEGAVDGVSGGDGAGSQGSEAGSSASADDPAADDSAQGDAGAGDSEPLLVPGVDPNATLPKGVTISIGETADGGSEVQILCGSDLCACSDGSDDDGDSLIDGADTECTSPFDNDESTFSTGIPGDNRDPKWQDCFFDGNSGAGDDDCRYHSDCLTGDFPADDESCQVTQLCKDTCQPLTPPGCDCFGCCEIRTETETLHIVVSDSCSMERIDDAEACPRCEPTDVCNNECSECEICVGQTLADLPESCFPPTLEPPTGSGGARNQDQPDGGLPPGSAGGTGSNGTGGAGNTPPPDDSPPAYEDGGAPPTRPPVNVCDGDVPSCLSTADCSGTSYCSLGCCRPTFIVR